MTNQLFSPLGKLAETKSLMGLSVEGLVLAYPRVGERGLQDVLEIEKLSFLPGQITCVIGPSGSGKTSLLYALAGFFDKPQSGAKTSQAVLRGELRRSGEKIQGPQLSSSFLFQDFGLFPWKTVRQNIELPLKLRHRSAVERRSKVDALLRELELGDSAAYYPAKISGGMKQRTAFARALISEPEFLLLDEPFSALDAFTRESAQDLLLLSLAKRPVTTVLVTHSIEEAVYLGDEVVVLNGTRPGRLLTTLKIEKTEDFRQSELFFQQVRHLRALFVSRSNKKQGPAT